MFEVGDRVVTTMGERLTPLLFPDLVGLSGTVTRKHPEKIGGSDLYAVKMDKDPNGLAVRWFFTEELTKVSA